MFTTSKVVFEDKLKIMKLENDRNIISTVKKMSTEERIFKKYIIVLN